MSVLNLDLVKAHVCADDLTVDDALLRHYTEAAEEWVVNATHRPLEELCEMGVGYFPTPLVQAMLLLIGHWYNQREAAATAQYHEAPYSVQALIKPYRRLAPDNV